MKNRQIIKQSHTNVNRYFIRGIEVSLSFVTAYNQAGGKEKIVTAREDDWFWDMFKENNA
jgi:hypothetical protein